MTKLGLAAMSAVLLACTGCQQDHQDVTNRSGSSSKACMATSIPVVAVPADSFSAVLRCDLVSKAMHALAHADLSSGVLQSDSAKVERITLTPLTASTDSVANQPEATWHVTLHLSQRPYDAEVILNRRNSVASVHRTHKPF